MRRRGKKRHSEKKMKKVGYRGVTTQLLYMIYMNAALDMHHIYDISLYMIQILISYLSWWRGHARLILRETRSTTRR